MFVSHYPAFCLLTPHCLQVTGRPGKNSLNQNQEFTLDEIVTEITQNRVKIDKTVARILETFNWYLISWLIAVIGQFEKCLGMDNPGESWRQALLDFAYQNIGFNLKQLIRVLCYDLQVTIHEGLVKVQDDLLEVIANFTDDFHITVMTLSAPLGACST